MGTISALHTILAWAVMITGGIAGALTTAAHWVEAMRVKQLWWLHHLFHALIAVQVSLGAVIIATSDLDANGEHLFYGFLTFIGVGLIIGYRHLAEYKYLLYGLGGLFVMGLAIRAFTLPALAIGG